MRSLIIIACTFLICSQAQAQTISDGFDYFSQYYYQMNLYNPAYAGRYYQPTAYVGYRLENRRDSQPFAMNAVLQGQTNEEKFGFGVIFSTLDYSQSVFASYDSSRHQQYFVGGQLNMGFDTGDEMQGLVGVSTSLLHYERNVDGSIGSSAVINNVNENYFKTNLDIGVLLVWKELNLGVSVIHNNQPKFITGTQIQSTGVETEVSKQFRSETYLTASYDIFLSNEMLVTPLILVNSILAGNQSRGSGIGNNANKTKIDLGVMYEYGNTVQGTFNYKINDPYYWGSAMLALKLKGSFQFIYSYDFKKKIAKNNNFKYNRMEFGLAWYMFRS